MSQTAGTGSNPLSVSLPSVFDTTGQNHSFNPKQLRYLCLTDVHSRNQSLIKRSVVTLSSDYFKSRQKLGLSETTWAVLNSSTVCSTDTYRNETFQLKSNQNQHQNKNQNQFLDSIQDLRLNGRILLEDHQYEYLCASKLSRKQSCHEGMAGIFEIYSESVSATTGSSFLTLFQHSNPINNQQNKENIQLNEEHHLSKTAVLCWKILCHLLAKRKIMLITLLLLFLLNQQSSGFSAQAAKNGFRCNNDKSHKTACLPKEYSKFELPIKQAEGNNLIRVTIDIDEVLRINDKDYSITFSCYFNVEWKEKRIHLGPKFGAEQCSANGGGAECTNTTGNKDIIVPMNLEFVKDLWLPNIFIYNLKTYKVIDVLNKLAGLWIGADKTVLYSQATHITFICPMRFDKFPLDTQTCKFQVGSYSYNDKIMRFITAQAGYSGDKGGNSIALDYAIKISKLKKSDSIFAGGGLGNFSLAGFEMVLHRYVSTYIITYYLPSGLFVIVSWISFLIPMDVIPGRMALLVTLFLVLVNIFNTVTTNTPKAEGLTAIEAWMLACILFVFGALIEYAAILFKKQRYVSSQHRMNIKIVCKDNFKYEVQERAATNAVSLQQLAEEYWRIDKFFLISFPILFFIFNIIYWLAFIL